MTYGEKMGLLLALVGTCYLAADGVDGAIGILTFLIGGCILVMAGKKES